MSNPPTGYNTPKTNWKSADVVLPTDLNRIEGNINAIETGSRTIDPAQSPSGNSGSLRQWLDWFPNMIKKITGKTNWYDTPDTTLAAAKTHIDATTVHGATNAATANRIILRDASGRAKVAAPLASADIATKGYVDSAVSVVGVSDTLALAYVPSEVELRPYPTAKLQFRLSCAGSLRISFMYRATRGERYANVYIYRIRDGTATKLYSSPPYYPSRWPNWISASTDISGWLVGDYLGFYCTEEDFVLGGNLDIYPLHSLARIKDVYIKASPIVRTV